MKKAFLFCSTAALLLWGAFLPPVEGSAAEVPAVETAAGAALKEEALLSRRTTYYNMENVGRAHNVELAAERISGITLQPKESFSFNGAVGERTAENGYEEAPVIEHGAYVAGLGGGVCQVSSTLFLAALEGGLRVLESRPHSLPVSYLPPSLDAMVSGWSDLKLMNPRAFPVRIEASAEGGELTVSLFGTPDGLIYRAESVLLEETDRAVISESFLLVFGEGGELVSRTRVRRDVYVLPLPPEEEPKKP